MSFATSFATTLPAPVLDTVLGHLAGLFLTASAGDPIAARETAHQMLDAYQPETHDELRLAAEIISFGFHALEALSQAANPDLPLTKVLRLRGSAVSLSRESHKSQRKLDQLQKDRRASRLVQPDQAEAPPPLPEPMRPQIDKALALIEATRQATLPIARNGDKTWTQGYQQRHPARPLVESAKNCHPAHASAAFSPAIAALLGDAPAG